MPKPLHAVLQVKKRMAKPLGIALRGLQERGGALDEQGEQGYGLKLVEHFDL